MGATMFGPTELSDPKVRYLGNDLAPVNPYVLVSKRKANRLAFVRRQVYKEAAMDDKAKDILQEYRSSDGILDCLEMNCRGGE